MDYLAKLYEYAYDVVRTTTSVFGTLCREGDAKETTVGTGRHPMNPTVRSLHANNLKIHAIVMTHIRHGMLTYYYHQSGAIHGTFRTASIAS